MAIRKVKHGLVNPTIPIPKAASDVHGITDERVAGEPTFKELAKQIHNMIKDSDLAGYNSDRFDIPLLAEEMLRAEVDFDLGNRVFGRMYKLFFTKWNSVPSRQPISSIVVKTLLMRIQLRQILMPLMKS